jgi:hypothetical protein
MRNKTIQIRPVTAKIAFIIDNNLTSKDLLGCQKISKNVEIVAQTTKNTKIIIRLKKVPNPFHPVLSPKKIFKPIKIASV